MMLKREPSPLPTSKEWLVHGFCGFTRRMVRKQFHAFGIQDQLILANPPKDHSPVIAYANHSGWWDPIVAMLCQQSYFPDRTMYAPIDAEALSKYRIMEQLGFYGVQLKTLKGAADFLTRTQSILEAPKTTIWITPEGRFCDVRDHSQPLMPGLSHLAHKIPGIYFIPLAIEYAFWNEGHPYILTRFGEPICQASTLSKVEWNELLTERLRATQRTLAQAVMDREPKSFRYLVENRTARRNWYDYARSWSTWIQGKPFDPRHDSRS